MSGAGGLPPGVEAAIRTAVRRAFDLGRRAESNRSAQALDVAQDYALSIIATAIIVGQAQAEAQAQDPHA